MYLKISFYEYAEHEWDDTCREYLTAEISVALQPGALAAAQQEDGGRHRHRQDQQHLVGQVQHRRDGQRAEGHMGQPVPDEGKALEHQRHPEQGGAQSDQNAHDQGVPDKGKSKIIL